MRAASAATGPVASQATICITSALVHIGSVVCRQTLWAPRTTWLMSFARNGICERESQLTGHGCLLDASLVLDVMNCLLLLMGGFSCLGVALPGYEQLFLF